MFIVVQVFISENFQYNRQVFMSTCIHICCHCWLLVYLKFLVNYTFVTSSYQFRCTDSQGCLSLIEMSIAKVHFIPIFASRMTLAIDIWCAWTLNIYPRRGYHNTTLLPIICFQICYFLTTNCHSKHTIIFIHEGMHEV